MRTGPIPVALQQWEASTSTSTPPESYAVHRRRRRLQINYDFKPYGIGSLPLSPTGLRLKIYNIL
jgi:hypothetical protein